MDEKTVDKIKKLLNLGKKTMFSGEAEKAMAAAMRLAAKIGINLEEIDTEEKPTIETHLVYKEKASFSPWERRLAHGIASALGCIVMIHCGYRQQFQIIGTQEDAMIFDAMYPFILKQLQGMYKEYKAKNEDGWVWNGENYYKKSWYYGAAVRIHERAAEIFRANTTEEEQAKYALVVADKLMVCKGYMDSNLHTTTMRRRSLYGSTSARESGYQAAGRVSFASNRIAG